MNWKATALIVLLALVGAAAGVLVGRHVMEPRGPALPPGTLVLEEGAKRPDAELPDLEGQLHRLSDFDGRPLHHRAVDEGQRLAGRAPTQEGPHHGR